jgi:hypothetical protein
MNSAALRPLRVGEILDAAIKLYRGNARVLMGAAATVIVPLQVLAGAVLLSTYSSGGDIPTSFGGVGATTTHSDTAARLGANGIIFVFGLLGNLLVTATCVKAISEAYLERPASLRSSLRFATGRLLALTGMEVLLLLGLIVFFILLIIPGIWLYAAWSVAVPALMVERLGPVGALGRSRRLVKGRWWPTAGTLLIATLMVEFVAGVIAGLLVALPLALTNNQPSLLLVVTLSATAGAVSGILARPFIATVLTVLYYDLRVRHEGYDVELMAEQLGLTPPAIPSQPEWQPG